MHSDWTANEIEALHCQGLHAPIGVKLWQDVPQHFNVNCWLGCNHDNLHFLFTPIVNGILKRPSSLAPCCVGPCLDLRVIGGRGQRWATHCLVISYGTPAVLPCPLCWSQQELVDLCLIGTPPHNTMCVVVCQYLSIIIIR